MPNWNIQMEPLYISLVRTFKIYSDERRPCSLQIVMMMVGFSKERNSSSVILFLFFQFHFFQSLFLHVNLGQFLFISVGKNLLFEVVAVDNLWNDEPRRTKQAKEWSQWVYCSYFHQFHRQSFFARLNQDKFCSVSQFPRLNFSCSIALTV